MDQQAEPLRETTLFPSPLALALPVTPQKEWLHMDTVSWRSSIGLQDLPPPAAADTGGEEGLLADRDAVEWEAGRARWPTGRG